MKKPRIGIVGLGDIAQKAYLPILSKEENWTLVGAFTPNSKKLKDICSNYRINAFQNLNNLYQSCDAVFVHSSTSSHFEIVRELLSQGKDVYVDKPLAETVEQAEILVDLSQKYKRKLMVGFNRRFAPLYIKAKEMCQAVAWIRIEKCRINKINPVYFEDSLVDSYIHLIDMARWMTDGTITLGSGTIKVNECKNLVYAHHGFRCPDGEQVFTGFHRKAGTGLELLEIVDINKIVRVKNLHTFETEEEGELKISETGSWTNTLKNKGFVDAVHHFIESIQGDTSPVVDGLEALKSQQLLETIIKY